MVQVGRLLRGGSRGNPGLQRVDIGLQVFFQFGAAGGIRLHHAGLDSRNEFVEPDETINTEDEPDHQALCDREQAFLLRAIQQDVDLSAHMEDAVNSLRIVLAADESVRTGRVVTL